MNSSEPEDTFNALLRTPLNEMIDIYLDFHNKCGLRGEEFEEARDALLKKHKWTAEEYRRELFAKY